MTKLQTIFSWGLSLAMGSVALGETIIPLPPAQKEGGMPLLETLSKRRTVRAMDKQKPLDMQMLGNLLWAANGLSDDKGHRTAPTAANKLEYELYVATASGVYHYDTTKHALKLVLAGDEGLKQARSFGSTEILLVVNKNKQSNEGLFHCDSGFIGQNIYLFCTAFDLGTVYRASFPKKKLNELIPLPEGSEILYTHSVGYKAAPKP